jgi:hypothetical protein
MASLYATTITANATAGMRIEPITIPIGANLDRYPKRLSPPRAYAQKVIVAVDRREDRIDINRTGMGASQASGLNPTSPVEKK